MKNLNFIFFAILASTLFTHGCGGELTQTWSTPTSSSSASAQPALGYSALPNGVGGTVYEAVEYSVFDQVDRQASINLFEKTVYSLLKESGCQQCHSSATLAHPPLIADLDLDLAHDHALTQINPRSPKHSPLNQQIGVYRHHCWNVGCAALSDQLLDQLNLWFAVIEGKLPEAPALAPLNQIITPSQVENWINKDKALLQPEDRPYVVYTSLHELHNEGLTAYQLNIVRTALSKALNSAARWAPEIVNPTDINAKGIVYKFDIRDFWGYNQGVEKLLYGGSEDTGAFGSQGPRHYLGEYVQWDQEYNFSGITEVDYDHALRIWQRILHGNVEGGINIPPPPNIDGFKGERSSNAAGYFVAHEDLKWVEASQLVYTLTRPDVYNAIMMNAYQADELERSIEVDISHGVDSYDYVLTQDAQSVDSRLTLRGDTPQGHFYKTFSVFSGQLASGEDRNIYDVYADPLGEDIRFPFWANPIPRFVNWFNTDPDSTHYSFVATLAQTLDANIDGFTRPDAEGCDPVAGLIGPDFGLCRHYTGTGGMQQSESKIIYSLPNGLHGYFLSGASNQRRTSAFANVERDPRRIPDATDDIAYMTGYNYSLKATSDQYSEPRVTDGRLIIGESCFTCHDDGIKRANNDLRHWLDTAPERLPKGPYGVTQWIDNMDTVARVKELYPPQEQLAQTMENDRLVYLKSLAKIKQGMILGTDKNIYLEPISWTIDYVRDQKYFYTLQTDN